MLKAWDSGFEHQRQRRGQPLKKTTGRIPGPSWRLNFWILNIVACIC